MSFQRIVLIIALVILMLALIIIGVMLYNKQYDIKFPPEVGNCPDYYTSGPKNVCHNTIGVKVKNPNCNSMDFSSFSSFGNKAMKKKCGWAKECGVVWDGITNRNPPLC
tara:strand:+ start:1766 stop:2092 length:327 start_codon:yes stop_codon:yes gene_type:complete